MARNVRWTVPFKSFNGTSCRINIYDNDWPEGVTMGLLGAADPFFFEEDNSDDLLNDVLRYRTGYIKLIEQGDFGSLNAIYPTTSFERYVEVLYGSTVIFNGYIQVQDFSSEQVPVPRTLEFPVISPLGILEQKRHPIILPPAIRTLGSLLDAALANSDYSYVYLPNDNGVGSYGYPNPVNLGMYVFSLVVSPFNENFHHSMTTSPYTKVMRPESCTYMIEAICKAFGWICHDIPGALVFTAFDYKGSYIRYPVGHIGDSSYREATDIPTTASDLTDSFTLCDDASYVKTLLPDTGIEISYEGKLSTEEKFSFARSVFDGIVTMGGMTPEDGERYSLCNLGFQQTMLYEVTGVGAATFSTDQYGNSVVDIGQSAVAWNGYEGVLISLSGAAADMSEMFRIRYYTRQRRDRGWRISFKGMSSNNGQGSYNTSLAALKNDDKIYNGYIQTVKNITDNYVEVIFKYHYYNGAGTSYPSLPLHTLIFVYDITFELLEDNEPYASYRYTPASDSDILSPNGSEDGNPTVSSSIKMPISLYRLTDNLIGNSVRSTKLTTYPYLFQPRKELTGKFRISSILPFPHARLFNYDNKKWRIIAQSFHPWDDEYTLTLQNSNTLN